MGNCRVAQELKTYPAIDLDAGSPFSRVPSPHEARKGLKNKIFAPAADFLLLRSSSFPLLPLLYSLTFSHLTFPPSTPPLEANRDSLFDQKLGSPFDPRMWRQKSGRRYVARGGGCGDNPMPPPRHAWRPSPDPNANHFSIQKWGHNFFLYNYNGIFFDPTFGLFWDFFF